MGMSTHVIGIKPSDDHWKRMKAALDACRQAGVEPPRSVIDFFDGEEPDEKGVTISLTKDIRGPWDNEPHYVAKEWSDDTREGYEVDIRELPKDVKIIRFYNSW